MNRSLPLGFILVLALLLPESMLAQLGGPNGKGKWSDVIPMPIVSVASANLPNGKILTWSAYDRFRFGGNRGKTYTVIFDPATNTSEEFLISDTQHDMFCPGTANLSDGRVIVTGGSSSPKTSIYDPFTNQWTSSANLNIPRGYHSMVTLSDGNVFTIGGSWSGGRGNKHSEIWDYETGTWSRKEGIPVAAMGNSSDYHAWLWQAPNGKLFHAGPTREMHWIDYSTPEGSYTSAGSRAADDHAFSGAIVMYDKGKLLKMGGAVSFSGNQIANGITTIIDINQEQVGLERVGDMKIPRALHNAIVLPTGEVFIGGGLERAKYFSDTNSRLTPEIWSPKTKQWRTLAPMQIPRNYHSISILLPDGRIMLAGGGLCGSCTENHPDAEIYSPPYLFKADGSPASRPAIQSAPTAAPQNSVLTISTDKAVDYFSIVRFSSNTHSTNNEQRRIELEANHVGTNLYQVTIPDVNVAVPGYYMLFAVDAEGVPSVSKSIMLDPSAPKQEINLPANFFAHWKLNNNAKDAIGDADGQLKGGATLINDAERGKVLSVKQNGQHVLVTPKEQLQVGFGGKDFSVAFWMNLKQSHTGQWRSIMHKGASGRDRTFAMWMRPNDNKLHYRISTTASWNEGGDSKSAIPLNKWTHVAYIKQGNQLKLYINGQLDQTVNLRGRVLSNNANLYLGDNPWSPPAVGSMDDVRLYGRALSANEVSTLVGPIDTGCDASGNITADFWYDAPGNNIENLPLGRTPDEKKVLNIFETPVDANDNYGVRVRGFVCAPATGNYTFWIASDDNGELWVSTDDNPDNKKKVAFVPGWTNAREWTKFASQKSAQIRLEKGKKYYVEALMKEGGGGDNLSVGWTLPDGKQERPIPGSYLSPYVGTDKLPQIVSIDPIADKITTSPAFNVNASATSGLGLTYAIVSGPATIAGKKITLKGTPGVVKVKVSQAGNNVYKAAESTRSFTVFEEGTNSCEGTGSIVQETWKNVPGMTIADIPANTSPDATKSISLFEIAPDTDDEYATRIRGFICPPVTGAYTFWIASDDHGELWLSTNNQVNKKRKIAHVNGWTPYRNWTFRNGQQSARINLVAGQKYYIEALQKEGGGGDNLSVGWQLPDGSMERPIPGNRLIPYSASSTQQGFTPIEESIALSAKDISVYPNPATSTVYLKWNGLDASPDNFHVRMCDLTGKCLIDEVLKADGAQINTRDLPNGIYQVLIEAEGYQQRSRVMILK